MPRQFFFGGIDDPIMTKVLSSASPAVSAQTTPRTTQVDGFFAFASSTDAPLGGFDRTLVLPAGDYRVVPMYTTVSMDVVTADTWWSTLRSLYKQKRRWAWGVENFPLIIRGFLATPGIPLREKFMHTIKVFEAHVAWATWGFMLTLINWLPALFAGREFSDTVMYFSAPRISGLIFNLGGLALAVTIGLSLLLMPRPASRMPLLLRVRHALEWLLVPVITLFFSAIPALDAQTRLMLGRRMEFWVAGKSRKAGAP